MLIALKSLNYPQQTARTRENNISTLNCSYIRYLLSNMIPFSDVLSLEHGLPKCI